MKKRVLAGVIASMLILCVKNEVVTPEIEKPDSGLKYATSTDLVINELCPSNGGVIRDESNDDPDWIELYNKGDSSVNLNNYALSDDSTKIGKWRFGNVVIKPKSYLLVFASGKDVNEIKESHATDTVSFLSVNSWSDKSLGGKSTVVPNEFTELYGSDERKRVILSATIDLVDNTPVLQWSSANITALFFRQQSTLKKDYSMFNTLEFTMTLEKDKPLLFRLTQGSNIPDWKAPGFLLTGTGIKNDIYRIPLVQGEKGLDLTKITGLQLEIPQYTFTSVSFTIRGVRFIHTGYNLHTNFKLSGNASRLYLSRPDTVILDTVPIQNVPTNMSMGKVESKWILLKKPTPGSANVQEYYTAISHTPKTVQQGGFYDSAVNVEFSSMGSGEEIYYTLDGSIPTQASKKYSAPIRIDSTKVLRFVSIKPGQLPSEVQSETFFIGEKTKLPVVSLITEPGSLFDPDTGIYEPGPDVEDTFPYFGGNFWKDKEVPAHIQFFENDRSLRFASDVGISIMGNYSRGDAKKSFGVSFREKYGRSELNYPLFPQAQNVTKFKKFVLRNNGGNYGKAMIEDPMMQSLIDDRGLDYQKYRPVVVFINGVYFGIHQLMEPANTDYLYSNYNLQDYQVDFFDCLGTMKQGTPENWNMLNDYLLTTLQTDSAITAELLDSSYQRVKQYMDVYNFIDYMAFEIYINNTDWPSNNCRWWRDRVNGKWRWMIYDTDFGFGSIGRSAQKYVSYNTLAFALDDTKAADDYPNGRAWTFFLRALLQNRSFKNDFVNRFATLIATNFEPQRVKSRIDLYAGEIKDEIPTDFKRWKLSVTRWQGYVDSLKQFANNRPSYVYRFIQEQFKASGMYKISLTAASGIITVNDMPIRSSTFKGTYFTGIPVKLTAIPPKGRVFKAWSDGNTENPRMVDSDKDIALEAAFE